MPCHCVAALRLARVRDFHNQTATHSITGYCCAGVATENILDAHINAIKVLQCIDKSGVLLEAVTLPIKSYLRSRPDTIRCVVKMLTQALH